MTGTWLLLYVVVALLICVIAAWERVRIQEAIRLVVLVATGGVLITPVSNFLSGILQCVGAFMQAHLTNHEPPEERTAYAQSPAAGASTASTVPSPRLYGRQGYHLARIVMSICLSACTVVFFVFAYAFGLATLSGMGLIPEKGKLAIEDTSVATYALIAAAVVWGALILEIAGWTRFLPPFSPRVRRVLGCVAASMLVLAISVEMAMGYWRTVASPQRTPTRSATVALASESTGTASLVLGADVSSFSARREPGASATGSDANLVKAFVATALPALVLTSAVVSATGTMWLLEYLFVFATALMVMPLALLNNLLLPVWNNLVGHLIAALNALVDFVANVGERMLTVRWQPSEHEGPPAGSEASASVGAHSGDVRPPDGPPLDAPAEPTGTAGPRPTGVESPGIDGNWFFMGESDQREGASS